MKGYPGAVKSVMTGATLASLLLLGGANADAGEGRGADGLLLSRKLDYESARPELGPDVSTCWNESVCLAANSPRGWQKEMERLQPKLCVLPAPDAPKRQNWSRKGLLVVAYHGGLSGKSTQVTGVTRTLNTLLVDVSLTTQEDGCGYCDQDEVRLSRRDLAGVTTVLVRYTCDDCGPAAASMQSYAVGSDGGVDAGDPSDNVVSLSWGSLKATYR